MILNGKQAINMPDKNNNILKYGNFHKQLPVPFIIYADFEAITKFKEANPIKTIRIQIYTKKHTDCGFGYKVVCYYDEKYSKPVQIYRGEKAVYKFMENMLVEVEWCKNTMRENVKRDINMTKEDIEDFKTADKCYICNKKYTKKDTKVRDCHITGKPK